MSGGGQTRAPLAPIVGYALFDFANSAFSTVVSTFVFATYFTTAIAKDPVTGAAQWSLTMAVAGVVIAVASPVLGAVADQTGRRIPWLASLSAISIVATALLWFAKPTTDDVSFALVDVAIATIAFETGMLFYNATLPSVAPPHMMGRVSGWSWGTGYIGGLLCLVVALVGFVQTRTPPFGLSTTQAEPVRATSVLTAVWFLVFSVPLFAFVRDRKAVRQPLVPAIRSGLRQLAQTFHAARRQRNTFRFLIAAMIYSDAVTTVFALGGVYAAATYGMDISGVIKLGIALNVTAGIGAILGGWIDDRIGSRRTIVLSLIALIVTASAVLLAPNETMFWIAALAMSTFFGPVQAASRTLMARLAPEEIRTEMFGLFALSGKLTAFMGPAAVGWITLATGSQRLGLASVLVFFTAGLWLMHGVREP